MDLSKHLEKAAEAVKRRNYKFAVDLYAQLLSLQPDNGEARTGLRQALFKKAEAKPPSRIFAMLGGGVHLMSAWLAGVFRAPSAAAKAYERYLTLDPLAEGPNLKLGQSLLKAGHKHSALAVYRAYAEAQPRCLEAARRAGALLYDAGDLNAALEMYEQALRIDPRDQEALKARKNLAAEGALKKTGIETAQSSRELVKDKDAQRRIEHGQRLQLTKEEIAAELDRLEPQLAERGTDVPLLLRVAELREMDKDLAGALDCLERAAAATPDDSSLANRAGDLRIRLQQKLVQDAKGRGDTSAAEHAERALGELKVAEFRRRSASHPTDLGLRFELGSGLLVTGQVDEAIAELQNAVKDPRRKVDALILLGRAFEQKGLPDLALGQWDKALAAAGPVGAQAKELLYEMGRVAQAQGRRDEALKHFSRILEQDIGFRDAAQRVNELRNG